MSFLIGRGRYARAVYPSSRGFTGFDSTPYLNQREWFVNYDDGDDANDGKTEETALADVAEIRRRWSGGIAGVRPQLPAIAVTVDVSGSPSSPFSDPHSVLADIDAQPGFSMVVNATPTVKRAGVVATVPNAFARTPTGEQTITDAGVADWTSDIDHPLHDTTTGAWTWVLMGTGTATINASRAASTGAAAETATVLQSGLSAAAVAAANAYEILTLPPAYFGTGSVFRMTPGNGATTRLATIEFRRFDYGAVNSKDGLRVESQAQFVALNSIGAIVQFAECVCRPQVTSIGGMLWTNCAFLNTGNVLGATFEDEHAEGAVLCGYARCSVTVGPGITCDQDFQIHGAFAFNTEFDIITVGTSFFGNVGRFLDGAADTTGIFVFGSLLFLHVYDAQAIFYGTSGAQPIAQVGPNLGIGGTLVVDDASATTTFQFNGGTAAAFQMAEQGNGFGFNTATGLNVGPTALTVARLDAALAAGSGFGSLALWPPNGSVIRVNA